MGYNNISTVAYRIIASYTEFFFLFIQKQVRKLVNLVAEPELVILQNWDLS